MCDYCGCRDSGPTAELNAEHDRLLALSEMLHRALHHGSDPDTVFAEFTRLLAMHSAKEEIGLFIHAERETDLGEMIETLCGEHELLHQWLADGPNSARVPEALKLLAAHIEEEEFGLFPVAFHALDPEQWDEVELAHRAIEAVWDEPTEPSYPDAP